MKREALKEMYSEEYEYLDFVKRSSTMNQIGLRGLEEGRTKRHHQLLRKYGFYPDKDPSVYLKSKVLLDNLTVMIDMDLYEKVSGQECKKLSDWLSSRAFREFIEGRADGIYHKGYYFN